MRGLHWIARLDGLGKGRNKCKENALYRRDNQTESKASPARLLGVKRNEIKIK
jgi:hypothetical protein